MMPKIWIVVADQSQARFFLLEKKSGPLIELLRLEHPAGLLREREIMADKPGRAFDSIGQNRHAMDPQVDAKEQEAARFAGEIVEHLERSRTEGRFDALVLVAGPQFLGALRKSMSTPLAQLVRQELPKNLGPHDAGEISAYLAERLEAITTVPAR